MERALKLYNAEAAVSAEGAVGRSYVCLYDVRNAAEPVQ
jgi:hypothetical protein